MTDVTAKKQPIIVKVLVGSRAHGTFRPDAPYEERSIYVGNSCYGRAHATQRYDHMPAREKRKGELLELYDFACLLLRNKPRMIEILAARPKATMPEGDELRAMLPAFLSKDLVRQRFLNAARRKSAKFQSQKRMFSDVRQDAMCDYLRLLFNGAELLRTGNMSVNVLQSDIGSSWFSAGRGELPVQEVLRLGGSLERQLERAYNESRLPSAVDLAPIDAFFDRIAQIA